jgi:hypothetical protein
MRVKVDNVLQKAISQQQQAQPAGTTPKSDASGKPSLPEVFKDAFSAVAAEVGKVVDEITHHHGQQYISPTAQDLTVALEGTLPTVLDPAQADQLASPTVTAQGDKSGTLSVTYQLKDAASAQALAAALNDGLDGIEENTAESCNISDFKNLKITAAGDKVIVTADFLSTAAESNGTASEPSAAAPRGGMRPV